MEEVPHHKDTCVINLLPSLCEVCLESVPDGQFISLSNCGCTFCSSCVHDYIDFRVSQGDVLDIPCLTLSCTNTIDEKQVENLLNDEQRLRYKRYLLNRRVERSASETFCPRPGCECVIQLSTDSQGSPVSIQCECCGYNFCSQCHALWTNADHYCEIDILVNTQNWMSALRNRLGSNTLTDRLVKKCPVCSVFIERAEGCAQMVCPRCRHLFCWFCLTLLDRDILLKHYQSGPCAGKLGHTEWQLIWHRIVIIIGLSCCVSAGLLLLPFIIICLPCLFLLTRLKLGPVPASPSEQSVPYPIRPVESTLDRTKREEESRPLPNTPVEYDFNPTTIMKSNNVEDLSTPPPPTMELWQTT